ncbi:hypothetical protein WN72_44695 [Bradyrhizobium arachidis]|uniref:Restriction alleviation protein, Lar family n=1 Tax=Bradyrhizobium arachidis TaxID=858423 RepID=A0AAE7NZW9_9BRAD|nr:hypothetical protein WN72_44695 [Bradyrhizobium arachidis]
MPRKPSDSPAVDPLRGFPVSVQPLRPCPFCGGSEAWINSDIDPKFVVCKECSAPLGRRPSIGTNEPPPKAHAINACSAPLNRAYGIFCRSDVRSWPRAEVSADCRHVGC